MQIVSCQVKIRLLSLPLLWKNRFVSICTLISIFLIYKCVWFFRFPFEPVRTSAWYSHWLMKKVKSLTLVCFYPYESHNFKIMTCFENYLLTLSKIVLVLGEIGYSIKNKKEREKWKGDTKSSKLTGN